MKSENFVVSAVFVTSLTVFAYLGLVGAKQSNAVSNQENRVLTSFPPLRSLRRDLPAFPAHFENFYNDHFLLRLSLAKLRNYLYFAILHSSGNASCAIGRNHWLFYCVNKLPVAQQNLEPYEEPELTGAVKLFCARRDLLAAHNIKYILVIAPEKGAIYPELMPQGWTRHSEPGRLEQLQAALAQKHVDCVDARSALIKSRLEKTPRHQLYFSNDSHWNRYGAFLVAQQLFRQLHQQFPAITPFQNNEVQLKNDNHSGDLAILLGLDKVIIDKDSLVASPLNKQAHEVDNSFLPRFESGVVETANEPTAYRTKDGKLPRSFILHDSFMEFLQPYLVEKFSFSEFHLARLLLPEAVLGEHPDVVIDEIAERHLYDRGFDNVPKFLDEITGKCTTEITARSSRKVASFQKQWQLLSVEAKNYKRSMGIELHWRALAGAKLNDRVQVTLLDSKTKEVKGVTEYRQDTFARSVKAGQEWVDTVPVTFFNNAQGNQVGIMVVKDSGAMYCDAPHCDYKVRALVDLATNSH